MDDTISGAIVLGTMLDPTTLITIFIAIRFRSILAAMPLIILVAIAIRLCFPHASFVQEAIVGQLLVGLLTQRLTAMIKGYPFMDDSRGILPLLYRQLPFVMADWVWHGRTKNLLNNLTRWIDRISVPIVITIIAMVVICYVFGLPIHGVHTLDFVLGYVWFWAYYLMFIVMPIMLVEGTGRFLYSLTRDDNFAQFCQWLGRGLRRLDRGKVERSKDWLTEGFKQPSDGAD